jgi:phosphoribosylglycinamide formyltransferase 1
MSVSVAVLISGRGSNMEALIKAANTPGYPARIALVIANKKDAKGLSIARQHEIKTLVIDHTRYANRDLFEEALHNALVSNKVQLVCLAGFMRILGAAFVKKWRGKLINIHPSLLPSLKGLNTHKRALEAGLKRHGCTVHFVSAEMDEGPIIAQAGVPVLYNDTVETLSNRVLESEHFLYPDCLSSLAHGDIDWSSSK